MCLFQLFVASSRLVIIFSNDTAGASAGRSAVSRKKGLLNLEALHYYLGHEMLSSYT